MKHLKQRIFLLDKYRKYVRNIKNISLKFAEGDQWVDEWPLTDWISNNGLPKVAEISFELEGFGQITRLYMLPSGEVL